MKKGKITIITILTLVSIFLAGCSKSGSVQSELVPVTETAISETSSTSREIQTNKAETTEHDITDQPKPVAVETNAAVEHGIGGKSYFIQGTYEVKDGKLTAATDDGLYHYVFKEKDGCYQFIQEESSKLTLTDQRFGVEVEDGAVFALKKTEKKEQVKISAVVKEIEKDYLLVSSRTDEMPGTFYVYFGELDVSKIVGGDEIEIQWDGTVTEDNRIYAENLEMR